MVKWLFFRILSRLINKDASSAPKDSPIPPPGPFVTPSAHCGFTEIQPAFVKAAENGENDKDESAESKDVEEKEVKMEEDKDQEVKQEKEKEEEKIKEENGEGKKTIN